MSLIVQVSKSGAGAAGQPQPQPPQVVAGTSPAPVTITAATPISQEKKAAAPVRHHLPIVVPQQPSAIAIASIAEQQQHIVQHHPAPLTVNAAEARLRMIKVPHPPLPQSPIRQSALPTRPTSVRLPQSPVRQPPQLPQNPIVGPQARLTTPNHIPQGRQVIVTHSGNRVSSQHFSMLPQQPTGHPPTALMPPIPTSGLIPQAPSGNLMPFPPSNLIPQPINANVSPKLITGTSSAVGIHHQFLSRPQVHQYAKIGGRNTPKVKHKRALTEEIEVSDVNLHPLAAAAGLHQLANARHQQPPLTNQHQVLSQPIKSSQHGPLSRGRSSTSSRSQAWQCQALQDHNYASKPPPTPPQSPSAALVPATISQNVVSSQNIGPETLIISHGRPNHPANSPFGGLPNSVLQPSIVVNSADVTTSGSTITSPNSAAPSREQQNNFSIEEAGVGPMAPLSEHGDGKDSDDDPIGGDEQESAGEGGEETETAPEAEQEDDDSITRCICDFLHDDGYMICCDKCSVWQHVVCMGLDRNNIPDEYLCEVCKPRQVDRKRAKALQSRRRTEIYKDSSSSDSENINTKTVSRKKGNKKILDRKADIKSTSLVKKGSRFSNSLKEVKSRQKPLNDNSKDSSKKHYRKRKQSDKNEKKFSSKKSIVNRRKSLVLDDDDEDDEYLEDRYEGDSDSALMNPKIDASQQLRSWIDQYEEAVTNHYSPELRARLTGNKLNGITCDLRPSVIGAPVKCNVSLKGNGVKILTACSNISSNIPIIECKGRLMLSSQFRSTLSPSAAKKSNHPHIFFYKLTDSLEICLDGKTYGNDSRFCRRSQDHNAELRHVIDKGSLHLFIVAVKSVAKNQEILLPLHDVKDKGNNSPLPSINADLKEIKKPNGILGGEERKIAKSRLKKFNKKSNKDKPANRKTRNQKSFDKEPEEEEEEEEEEVNSVNNTAEHSENESPLNGSADMNESPQSPSKSKPSPGKLGLPDNSGLIVGVNTINYDASSSLKNKAKSREERKMEMIMKAIEQMEKAEQRKKEQTETHSRHDSDRSSGQPGGKRRRSNSKHLNNQNDSALDASSADESPGRSETKWISKKRGKKKGSSTPQRRRSKVLSGESVSAMSENENTFDSNSTPTTANSTDGPFRFPKTKKSMVSDWFHETEAMEDDDVSGSYLRGSRSPPGIATHLLRSAPHSPIKNVCSAKKRWLRQAISEDHSEEATITNGSSSPSENNVDYVTPLKKRRLASYKGDQEVETQDGEKDSPNEKFVPNSLKKKLLHNLVLEAVLDKAMEDMLGGNNSGGIRTKAEECPNTPSPGKENEIKIDENKEMTKVIKKNDVLEELKINKANAKELLEQSSSSIKTPEPSSVFKSFFKSNVSIEDLEAEIEATKKRREEIKTLEPAEVEAPVSGECQVTPTPEIENVEKQEIKTEEDAAVTSHVVANTEIETKLEAETQPLNNEADLKTKDLEVKVNSHGNEIKQEPNLAKTETVSVPQEVSFKPKEKKRVSLADYKLRKKQEGRPLSRSSSISTPATTTAAASTGLDMPKSIAKEDGSGTPTLDEQTANTSAPPTLSTLPLFEKLEKLEQVHKENKQKVQQPTLPEIAEPKREDLTERLKKEFGLTIDDELGSNTDSDSNVQPTAASPNGDNLGDATPEMDDVSSIPPPPLTASVEAAVPHQHQPPSFHPPQRFTPTQYPSYPSNYPLPPYPKAGISASASSRYANSSSHSSIPPYPSSVPPQPTSGSSSSSGSHQYKERKEDSSRGSSSSRGSRDHYSSHGSSSGNSSRNYYYSSNRKSDNRRDRDYQYRDRDFRDFRGSRDSSSSRDRSSRHFHGRGDYYRS